MKLSTQMESSFRSRFEDLKLHINQSSPWVISTDEALQEKALKYKFAMKRFEVQKASIATEIRTWKACVVNLKKNEHEIVPAPDLKKLNQKNKLKNTCISILNVVGGIFLGVGYTSLLIMHGLGRVRCPVPMHLFFCALALTGIGAALLGIGYLLKDTKLSRQVRLHNSENFKDFLRNVVGVKAKENEWHLSKENLLNPKLHELYQRYKVAAFELPCD